MFRFAFIDVLKNSQNSYNQYKYFANKKIALPLIANYDSNNEFKKFEKKIFNEVNDEKKKWDKDYSKFTYYKYIKNINEPKDDLPEDDDNDKFLSKNTLVTFAVITLFTGAGIYLLRKSFFHKNS
jgi:phenylalanine-4-hydroxylase